MAAKYLQSKYRGNKKHSPCAIGLFTIINRC